MVPGGTVPRIGHLRRGPARLVLFALLVLDPFFAGRGDEQVVFRELRAGDQLVLRVGLEEVVGVRFVEQFSQSGSGFCSSASFTAPYAFG